jgi:CHAT domain-containing protein
VLTVGDPAYPQSKANVAQLDPKGKRSILGLQGQMPRLPKSGVESREVAKLFKNHVLALEGEEATEAKVAAGVAGRQIIHLAAHGFADERFGNLFGAIALTPPKDTFAPENDGFLSLHEIYRLPLKQCELAVLSACMTNVGPQQPLEAGVTLANGFLAAGARRVIASHWEVEEDSTAELMRLFFTELAGDPQNSVQALQRARQRIRMTPGWSDPYHWAPFILIGPGE